MRRMLAVVLLALVSACTPMGAYVEADAITYEAIAPAHAAYIEADAALTPAQRARRLRTLETWRIRVQAARKANGGG